MFLIVALSENSMLDLGLGGHEFGPDRELTFEQGRKVFQVCLSPNFGEKLEAFVARFQVCLDRSGNFAICSNLAESGVENLPEIVISMRCSDFAVLLDDADRDDV